MEYQFGKVGVLYGGHSSERDVSLMSGAGVHQALVSQGVDAHLFDTGLHSLEELAAQKFERVFINLHGQYGEDGTIQGALELLGVPYTGCGPLASAIAMNKLMTKRIWLTHGVSTPKFVQVNSFEDLKQAITSLGYPSMLKAPHAGSSIGMVKIESPDQLSQAYQEISVFENELLLEQFVTGRELTVAIIGSFDEARALPVIEIKAPSGNYNYQNKYFTDDTVYECPADLPEVLAQAIQKECLNAYRALGCEGWGRVDVMLSADQKPYLLEVNTSPGMTSHSLVPMAAKAVGMSYEQLCLHILSTANCKLHANAVKV